MFNFSFDEAHLLTFFSQYAYQPMYVYGFITMFMFASSFGLPVPEEVVLISAGLIAYTASHPQLYPPPFPGAEGTNIVTLCVVCFLAVFLSDLLVFFIGKFFGSKIIKTKFFQKQVAGENFDRINSWFKKYGGLACGIFRFTPGVRFPGHLSCGLLGISTMTFVAVDGLAALLSVPTQVYFVATYGGEILAKLKEFKFFVLITLSVLAVIWVVRQKFLKKVSE